MRNLDEVLDCVCSTRLSVAGVIDHSTESALITAISIPEAGVSMPETLISAVLETVAEPES